MIIMVMFSSCRTKSVFTSDDYLIVYDNFDGCRQVVENGETYIHSLYGPATILILKKDENNPEKNSYESYFMGGWSFTGKWKVDGDTLYLCPLYEFLYGETTKMTKIDTNSPTYPMEGMISQKWIIKGDLIYEKTELSKHSKNDENGSIDYQGGSLRLRSRAKLR